jgi:REP element-mobilizing transposase RayT
MRPPDRARERTARRRMTEPPLVLTVAQRRLVERTIAEHCRVRGWTLHVVNARTNHVHVVVSAASVHPDSVRDQFKAWCTRRLREQPEPGSCRWKWWTEGGSDRFLNDERSVEAAILYVRDAQ